MLARCMAERGVVFRVAHRKSSRFLSRAGSPKHGGFAYASLVLIHARGGGRIRTMESDVLKCGDGEHRPNQPITPPDD
jgi:hypothetical protein